MLKMFCNMFTLSAYGYCSALWLWGGEFSGALWWHMLPPLVPSFANMHVGSLRVRRSNDVRFDSCSAVVSMAWGHAGLADEETDGHDGVNICEL